ncbi:hypothetical protein Sjap_003053 [Stephania japonica]|uniref:Uncharacterized protein n=1 Tax=Stephania japonica TaxID=461633 RepID=A0AAP0PT52_9MAGN
MSFLQRLFQLVLEVANLLQQGHNMQLNMFVLMVSKQSTIPKLVCQWSLAQVFLLSIKVSLALFSLF